jgi:hypothetical protein
MSKSRARFFAEIARSASSLDTLITDTSALSSLAASQSDLEALIGTSSIILPSGTTAERPASPSTGAVRFNTTLSRYEGYNGVQWSFLNDAPSVTVEYLVIAGGGGGAGAIGGGGGAGGYRSSVSGETSGAGSPAEAALSVPLSTALNIRIGAGGSGGPDTGSGGAVTGTNGANSIFSTITSIGGGTSRTYLGNGLDGGSGGGGARNSGLGGSGTADQGFAGGTGSATGGTDGQGSGAGGGGAGSVGGNASGSTPGSGGSGVASSITGSSVTRAGGGGGGSYQGSTSSGGSGGGGRGGDGTTSSLAGTANTGSGGGAGGYKYNGSKSGSNGGSGVIIVKVPEGYSATFSAGVTQTSATVGTNTVYTVTAAGASDTVTFEAA